MFGGQIDTKSHGARQTIYRMHQIPNVPPFSVDQRMNNAKTSELTKDTKSLELALQLIVFARVSKGKRNA